MSLVAVFLLGLVAQPVAHAYHRDRYEELQKKIEETKDKIRRANQQEKDLLAKIEASDQRRSAMEDRLHSIGAQLEAARNRLALMEVRLDRISGELTLVTHELEQALGDFEDQTNQLNERAANIYMLGPIDRSIVLLGADTLQDAIAGHEYLRSVLNADSVLLDRIRATKERIEASRSAIQAKKQEMEEATARQEEETRRISAMHSQQAAARAEVLQEIAYREQLLEQVRDQKEAFRRALRSYEQESESILDYLRSAQGGQGSYSGGKKGYFIWPVHGPVTSGYGWRTHPIYGYRSFHTGIDIGSPYGTSVRAGRTGEVLYTGYKGAFGLIVLVDHGESIATMYAHLSQVYVRPGERVRTGESIAAVGCTGWCTGPHVHFEVRVNGQPSNPMAWL